MKLFMVHEDPWHAGNPYISTLIEELSRQHPDISISWGRNLFWSDDIFTYDVVHFHWPQAFMNGDTHSENDLLVHIKKMKQQGVRVVATCHDIEPHYNQCAKYRESLNIVYSLCDAIFHLGEYSQNLFEKRYPLINHFFLPHHLYDTLYTFSPAREESLKHLGLPTEKTYVLCFGTFRANVERDLVFRMCHQLHQNNIAVLAPGFMDVTASRRSIRGILQRLKKKYYRYRYHIYCSGKSFAAVPDKEVPYYYGAADIALIHRLKILNSGNAYLPILFNKVVVGPDIGNVGVILNSWGLPVFDTNSPKTVGNAILKGLTLNKKKYAEKLHEQLIINNSTKHIAMDLYRLYSRTLLTKC